MLIFQVYLIGKERHDQKLLCVGFFPFDPKPYIHMGSSMLFHVVPTIPTHIKPMVCVLASGWMVIESLSKMKKKNISGRNLESACFTKLSEGQTQASVIYGPLTEGH